LRELKVKEVKALVEAVGEKVTEAELSPLTVRLNGMLELLYQLKSLPLDNAEIIPTLLMQRKD
jgi:hypothetical protein